MKISHQIINKICVFYFDGPMTLHNSEKAQEYVMPIINPSWRQPVEQSSISLKSIIFNWKKVDMFDSLGASFIISTYKQLQKLSIPFSLCEVNHKNLALLKSLSLDTFLILYQTEMEALNQSEKASDEEKRK